MAASFRKGAWVRGFSLGMALAVAVSLLLVLIGVGCSDDSTQAVSASQRMRELLGHAPKGLAATIAKRGDMIAANTESFPPLSYRDDEGELVGFDVQVAKAVAEYLSLGARFAQPSWEAVPAGLAGGRFDVSIGSLSPEQGLEGEVVYTKPYYYTTGQLVIRAGSPALVGVDALAGKSVGAGIHTVFYRWLQANTSADVSAFPGDAEALAALEAGRVDAVLTSGLVAAQSVKSGKGVELSGAPLLAEPMVFVVRAGESDWLAVLNDAIAGLRSDGTLKQLSIDWLGANYTKPTPAASVSQ